MGKIIDKKLQASEEKTLAGLFGVEYAKKFFKNSPIEVSEFREKGEIKSIPEEYKNILFKSKLEVSWAKWLDEHEITWSYESEGFEIGRIYYLPDFYMPELNTFLEVKGGIQGLEKAFAFFKALNQLNIIEEIKKGRTHRTRGFESIKYQVFVNPTYLFLLGGSPVPALYNIHDGYYELIYCSNCGKNGINISESNICRGCGSNDFNIEAIWNGEKHNVLLQAPSEWLALKNALIFYLDQEILSAFREI